MGDKSKIEWTEATVNIVTGCTSARPKGGCKNCYARRLFPRVYSGRKFSDVQFHEERLEQLARWQRCRKVFLNSMGDTFHEQVTDDQLRKIFDTIEKTPQHTYQVLTKRYERAAAYINRLGDNVPENLWIGMSADDQESATEACNWLINAGGHVRVRFLSLEPLLGPINLISAMFNGYGDGNWKSHEDLRGCNCLQFVDGCGYGLDWVIVGGESGPKARPMRIDWVRDIRDQCAADGLPFFFKQWGEWGPAANSVKGEDGRYAIVRTNGEYCTVDKHPGQYTDLRNYIAERRGKKANGKMIDGREHTVYPNPNKWDIKDSD